MNEGEFAARLGLVGIPNAAEAVMLERDMRLVALTGGAITRPRCPRSSRWKSSSARATPASTSAPPCQSITSR
jgi:hypothetical protein